MGAAERPGQLSTPPPCPILDARAHSSLLPGPRPGLPSPSLPLSLHPQVWPIRPQALSPKFSLSSVGRAWHRCWGQGEHFCSSGPRLGLSPRPLSLSPGAARRLRKASEGPQAQAAFSLRSPPCGGCPLAPSSPTADLGGTLTPTTLILPVGGSAACFLATEAEASPRYFQCQGGPRPPPSTVRRVGLEEPKPSCLPSLPLSGPEDQGPRGLGYRVPPAGGIWEGLSPPLGTGGGTCLACLGNYIAAFHFTCQFSLPGDVGS